MHFSVFFFSGRRGRLTSKKGPSKSQNLYHDDTGDRRLMRPLTKFNTSVSFAKSKVTMISSFHAISSKRPFSYCLRIDPPSLMTSLSEVSDLHSQEWDDGSEFDDTRNAGSKAEIEKGLCHFWRLFEAAA